MNPLHSSVIFIGFSGYCWIFFVFYVVGYSHGINKKGTRL